MVVRSRLGFAALAGVLALVVACAPEQSDTAPEGPSPRSATPSATAPVPTPEESLDVADLRDKVAKQADKLPELGPGPVYGADISWPNCPEGMGIAQRRTLGLPMPLPRAEFVIVGLTNGPGYTPNPCLADQVKWVKERKLLLGAYSVVSYPLPEQLDRYRDAGPFDGTKLTGALKNNGYYQAEYNLKNMQRAGFSAPTVWVDVETVVQFDWTSNKANNAAVVRGMVKGYRDAGVKVAIYSTPAIWDGIVGDLAFGVPEWRAAGASGEAEAVNRCSADWTIQGGDGFIGQWVEGNRDLNVSCPGKSSQLARFFQQM